MMRELTTDLEKIKYWGQKNMDRNFEFRSFLKFNERDDIDDIVHRLDTEIRKRIDCKTCGNCCIEQSPLLTKKDVSRISEHVGLSEHEFIENYIDSSDQDELVFAKRPCKFLVDRKCIIYAIRPNDCVSYPHTQKKQFTSRLLGVIQNYSVCPIVFNIVERLKLELNFRR